MCHFLSITPTILFALRALFNHSSKLGPKKGNVFFCVFKAPFIGQNSLHQCFPKAICVSILSVTPSEMRRPSFTSSLCSISQKLRAKTHSCANLPLETPSKAATPQPYLETQQPQPAASSFHAHEEGKTKHWYRSRKRNSLNGSVKETGLVFW